MIDYSDNLAAAEAALYSEYSEEAIAQETLLALGAPLMLGKEKILPLTAGSLAILRRLQSPIVTCKEADPAAGYLFYYVIQQREKIIDYISDPDDEKLLSAAAKFAENTEIAPSWIVSLARNYYKIQFSGFDMLPATGAGDPLKHSAFQYDSAWIANLITKISTITNDNSHDILWNIPFSRHGFIIAEYYRERQDKPVRRKLNHKAWTETLKGAANA